MEVYRKRLDSFGFHAIVVDGHDVVELIKAFEVAANTKDKPTALICKTFKGILPPRLLLNCFHVVCYWANILGKCEIGLPNLK